MVVNLKKFVHVATITIGILFFTGCGSTQFHVPGEKKVVIENIYVEYYNFGNEYFRLKNYSKAAEFYMKASSSKYLHNGALYDAARSYALAKDWENALKIFLEIEKHDKNNVEVQEGLAYIYAQTNDFDKAESMYKSLLEENPDVSEVLVNYTILLLTKEKYEEAKENLEKLKEKFPDEEKIKTIEEKITAWEDSQKEGDEEGIPEELKEI